MSDSSGAPRLITLTPRIGKKTGYHSIKAGLSGDTTYGPNSGSGGWQIVDRPKMVAATQWMDRAPFNLQMDLILDKSITVGIPSGQAVPTGPNLSIEAECRQLESWADKVPNSLIPPIIKISGPVPGTEKVWVMHTLQFKEAIRDVRAGFRYQQNVHVEFYEYTPPLNNILGTYKDGPAANWSNNQTLNTGTQSYYSYTVKQGDTLQKIANKFYDGSKKQVQNIATFNGIRDQRSQLYPGQIIILPRDSITWQ